MDPVPSGVIWLALVLTVIAVWCIVRIYGFVCQCRWAAKNSHRSSKVSTMVTKIFREARGQCGYDPNKDHFGLLTTLSELQDLALQIFLEVDKASKTRASRKKWEKEFIEKVEYPAIEVLYFPDYLEKIFG